jgi:hypothetical protein
MTKPKKDSDDVPAPKLEEVSEDQRLAEFFAYKKRLIPLLEALKDARDDVKELYAEAKQQGIWKKELELAIALDTPEGEEKAKSDFERTLRIAKWMGVPIGSQVDMFDEPKGDAKHFEAGKRAALADEPARSPPGLGQSDAQHWLEGHSAGRIALNEVRARQFRSSAKDEFVDTLAH